MLKRTKGRLLITLLVVTGLAGTLNTSSISQKERKQAVQLMKSSKTDVLKSVEGLSEKQFNYRNTPNSPSIAEILQAVSQREELFTAELQNTMNQSSDSEKRLLLGHKDQQLSMATRNFSLVNTKEKIPVKHKIGRESALANFTTYRNANLKYIRTSTEDLRNHVTTSELGYVDCYQKFLILGEQTKVAVEQIEAIKKEKNFPGN